MPADGVTPQAGSDEAGGALSLNQGASVLSQLLDDDEPESPPKPVQAENGRPQKVAQEAAKPEGEPEQSEEEPKEDDWDANPDQAANESDTEDEGSDQPRDEQGRFVAKTAKVKLDDGKEVTVDELIRGNLMQADYSRKTMELADQRKAVTSREADMNAKETQLNEIFEIVSSLVENYAPTEPDVALIQQDPFAYMQQKAAYDKHIATVQSMREAKAKQTETAKLETVKQSQEKLKEEVGKFLMAEPSLRDQKRFTAFIKEAHTIFPERYGISTDEIDSIADHRIMRVLADNLRYQRMLNARSKQPDGKKDVPPVLKSGKRAASEDAKSVANRQADEAFRNQPSIKNAGKFFEQFL